jgi:hypothetical protein
MRKSERIHGLSLMDKTPQGLSTYNFTLNQSQIPFIVYLGKIIYNLSKNTLHISENAHCI